MAAPVCVVIDIFEGDTCGNGLSCSIFPSCIRSFYLDNIFGFWPSISMGSAVALRHGHCRSYRNVIQCRNYLFIHRRLNTQGNYFIINCRSCLIFVIVRIPFRGFAVGFKTAVGLYIHAPGLEVFMTSSSPSVMGSFVGIEISCGA